MNSLTSSNLFHRQLIDVENSQINFLNKNNIRLVRQGEETNASRQLLTLNKNNNLFVSFTPVMSQNKNLTHTSCSYIYLSPSQGHLHQKLNTGNVCKKINR